MRLGIAAGLLAALLFAGRPEAAEPLRILRPVDLGALPLLVMEHEHLIERTAEAMGLGEVKVSWGAIGAPSATAPADPLAAIARGQADLAMSELVPFVAAADANSGTPGELRALAAVVQRPYVLVARKPAIHTILDFGPTDRIAVPAPAFSGPAVMLEMAAAAEWGPEHYNWLNRLVVARSDGDAADQLLAGKGGIDAHFSHSPYTDDELGDPAIHRVMDSFDIAGPHTAAVLAGTERFAAANGELTKAVLSALQAADDYIKKTPGAAAEIFAAAAHGQNLDIPLEDLSDMIGDPDLAYRAAPAGATRLLAFMQRIGRLKHPVARWQDLFMAAARDLPGD